MIELTPELARALDSGLTLVVPSAQRAAAVRLAYTARQLADGRLSWPSPLVLPWRTWLERELQAAAVADAYRWRTLQPLEESLLWREAATEAAAGHALLHPSLLAEGARRALALAQEWAIPLHGDSDELLLLNATIAGFRRRVAALRAVTASDCAGWPATFRPDCSQVRLAGFAAVGPARLRWLRQNAGVIDNHTDNHADDHALVAEQPHAESVAFEPPAIEQWPDAAAEYRAAAQWSRELLSADPRARLLIVVPQLDARRALLTQCFLGALHAADVMRGTVPAEPLFAIEGGIPLGDYALVRAALDLLRLVTAKLEFAELSALLRSPYLGFAEPAARLELDLWLRDSSLLDCDAAAVGVLAQRAAAPQVRRPRAPTALGKLNGLLQSLPLDAAPPREVAERLAAFLEQVGWPGIAPLNSEEQQIRVRFEELLGDLARLGSARRSLRAPEAVQLLATQAAQQNFAPSTADVPVTLTSDMGDPLVHYDAIRVCGLDAGQWPRTATPDAFLPVLAQRAAGVPAASAAGQLELARQAMRGWHERSSACVYSYARMEDDVELRPTPLARESATPVAQLQPDLVARIRTQRRGAWRPREPGASWRGEPQLPAGTRLLELQAACPYRAYAELRLDAVALGEPAPGIDPRVRGQLLHAALEHLWRQLGDQRALLQLSADAAVTVCEAAAAAAVQRIVPRLPWPPEVGLLRRERSRIARLLLAELEWERRRPTFRAERLEYQTVLPLGEHTLALRIDRVDRLEDDRLLIIDYKSGAPARFDAEAARLPQPQLPAYAVALGTEVAAVASLHLRPEGVKARGLADSVERCGVTGSARPWDDQLQLWSAQLRELGDEFVAGRASVTPLEGVCRYCHLAYCCRISAVALEANGESGDVPTDEVAHGPA